MKSLIFAIAITFVSASITAQTSTTSQMINATMSSFINADKNAFSNSFMKKAVLIDASGKIITGQKDIQTWHNNLQASASTYEVMSKQTQNIAADLMNLAVQVTINKTEKVALSCLCRRIDGKWYYETCTIVPVPTVSSAVAMN